MGVVFSPVSNMYRAIRRSQTLSIEILRVSGEQPRHPHVRPGRRDLEYVGHDAPAQQLVKPGGRDAGVAPDQTDAGLLPQESLEERKHRPADAGAAKLR